MTEDMNVLAVSIARLEATLSGVVKQIDHQDRNSQQLVKLFEERITSRFDTIEKRLDSMERARDEARNAQTEDRRLVEARLHELEALATAKADAVKQAADERAELVEARVSVMERQWARAIGIALGAGISSGGAFAVISRALGAG